MPADIDEVPHVGSWVQNHSYVFRFILPFAELVKKLRTGEDFNQETFARTNGLTHAEMRELVDFAMKFVKSL